MGNRKDKSNEIEREEQKYKMLQNQSIRWVNINLYSTIKANIWNPYRAWPGNWHNQDKHLLQIVFHSQDFPTSSKTFYNVQK